MKKKTILLALLVAFMANTSVLIAQSTYNVNDLNEYISKTHVPKIEKAGYTGSPYLKDVFESGNISKNGITIAPNVKLRYNANKDYFEIKKNIALKDNQAQLLNRTTDLVINLNKDTFVYITPSSKNKEQGYFVELVKGDKVSLYKKIHKNYIPGQKAYSSMTRPIAPMFKEKVILYLYNSDGTLEELPSSKNAKLKAFNGHTKELKAFLKENKLNLNKEKDLIKITNYYNSL